MTENFHGVKIAILHKGNILVYLRDNKPGLRFAGLWDLPGGGREGKETPYECVRREILEETSVIIGASQIVWQKEYPAMHDATKRSFFMVAKVTAEQVKSMRFGDEGREWKLVSVEEYLRLDGAVSDLKMRFKHYLDSAKASQSENFVS